MKKLSFLLLALLLFSSHDMYLKLDTYFLQPDSPARIKLFNGTFDNSDNTIDRNRMAEVSFVGNGKRLAVDTTQWSEEDGVTVLSFTTGEAGTWVAGVSTHPRSIPLVAADFNSYLEHDGLLDMLDWRKKNNALDQDAVEKYSKHVKTIFQVGNQLTEDWQRPLGYPIEFIPMDNPYSLHPGHGMQVRLLWQGEPLANQLVYVGSQNTEHAHGAEHGHTHDHEHEGAEDHHHQELSQFRTDANGMFTFNITHKGIWYLRTIYLTPSEEEGLTHESNWATLTFEIGEGHSHDHHHAEEAHHHHEEDGFGIPSYVYWIGSFILVFVLFMWFNRKQA